MDLNERWGNETKRCIKMKKYRSKLINQENALNNNIILLI